MRRAVPAVAAACLLAGPAALAFFSGGFFAEPQIIAAIVAWSLVLALAAAGPAPLPGSRAGRLAVAGLVLLTAWSAISIAWAPLAGAAVHDVERLVLYVGAALVAVGTLRNGGAMRLVEPGVAAGAAIVIGYGLAGRLLPDIVELARSQSAGGRLEQPITYWNAEGALAAMGFIVCARLAGDAARPIAVRVMAAAAAPALAAGVYLTYSRGAIAVAVLGLLVLLALGPSRAQLAAVALAGATGVAAAAWSAAFPGVAALEGSHPARDGLVVLAGLLALAAIAALLTHRRGRVAEQAPPSWSRRLRPASLAAIACVTLGLAVGGLTERPDAGDPASGAKPERLTSVSSNRYEYWRVGLEAFGRNPIAGVGSGGFRVVWLQERTISEGVTNAHSLEVETAAELGLLGLLALALLVGGVIAAARTALARNAAAAAGPSAALLAWFLHASIDWDWQLPAVSLPAIVLAGAIVAIAESAPRGAAEERRDRRGERSLALSAGAGR
jgi:hypothetical protein